MQDSLKIISDSLSKLSSIKLDIAKDTIYVATQSSDSWLPIIFSSLAILVSFFTFVLLYKSDKFSRKYHKLINEPNLEFSYTFMKNEFELYILNSGHGAAIINDYKFYWDNKLIIHNIDFFDRLNFQSAEVDSYETLHPNTIIKSDGKVKIISFNPTKFENIPDEKVIELIALLKSNAKIELLYSNLFGESKNIKLTLVL